MIHENFHTEHSVFTAPDVHMHTHAYITQLYIMSIQPVNKAVEHIINSTPVLERRRKREREREKEKKEQSMLTL